MRGRGRRLTAPPELTPALRAVTQPPGKGNKHHEINHEMPARPRVPRSGLPLTSFCSLFNFVLSTLSAGFFSQGSGEGGCRTHTAPGSRPPVLRGVRLLTDLGHPVTHCHHGAFTVHPRPEGRGRPPAPCFSLAPGHLQFGALIPPIPPSWVFLEKMGIS